jgi:hypothetical protein
MKKIILLSGIFFALTSALTLKAQVTIGEQRAANATLEVVSSAKNAATPAGIIAPRLTGDELKAKDAQYTAAQTGAIVYATAAVGTSSAKTVNVKEVGYYYFDGAVWQAMKGSDPEPWNSSATKTRATDVNENIYHTGKVGIGDFSAAGATPATDLDIKASATGQGFKLNDGNQNIGYVLTSDANGVGTWHNSGVSMVLGSFPASNTGIEMSSRQSPGFIATEAYIDLPPGLWRIDLTLLAIIPTVKQGSTDKVFVQVSFVSDRTKLTIEDINSETGLGLQGGIGGYTAVADYVSNSGLYSLIKGTMAIRNESTSTKRYYLVTLNPQTIFLLNKQSVDIK